MPGLTITTDLRPASATTSPVILNPRRASVSSRTSSPSRPPISPITPTLESAELPGPGQTSPALTTTHSTMPDFAFGRPIFTHTTQTDQVGVAPPPAQPIDFDSNPDVLALKSAISILQLQRARATADIQSLSRARDAALANPDAFTADLAAGRVRVDGDRLFSGTRAAGDLAEDDPDSDSTSDSESDFDKDDDEVQKEEEEGSTRQQVTPESEPKTDGGGATPPTNGAEPPPRKSKKKKHKGKQNPADNTAATTTTTTQPPPWQRLPKPQSVVRCPPVNWAQYGVVGDSLDKLHAEQVAAPTPGAPMVLGQGGTYEFKAGGSEQAGAATGGEQPRRLVGVAAPYNPMRDKVEKKGKGGSRR
ncbi:hypothetical protein C8A01DRAFT_44879 [Parachaetomium inaequale]|uniref:Uncharacterized protein n=1 Tax=Parachaetomium inaequale TaxID=2588326 RepID=A0AAN6PNJ2_9PEZI|nr:hypothetical protein C8A01DRAFT_44879 [Parachaetomium inaequale]